MLQKILFILLFSFSFVVKAQLTKQLYFKHLTPKDGLTQISIADIYTDTKGFVWMTGMDGINRFDGSHCLANNEIAPGLENIGFTRKAIEDKNGDIWFGYSEGVIQYSYAANRFIEHKLVQLIQGKNKFNPPIYIPLSSDTESHLMIGGLIGKFMIYNTITRRIVFFDLPKGGSSSLVGLCIPPDLSSFKQGWKCVVKSGDTISVCTLRDIDKGVQRWHNIDFILSGDVAESLWMPDGNTMFLFNKDRVCKYELSTGRRSFSPTIKSQEVSFMPDAKGHLWISDTKYGLIALDTASMQILLHLTHNSKLNNSITSNNVYAYIDRNQMLWVAAWGKGVDYTNLNEERFASFLTAEDAKSIGYSNFVRGIIEAADGSFYCSTQSGIIALDSNLNFIKFMPGIPKGNQYPDIHLLEDKLYYASDIGESPGLYHYDLKSGIARRKNIIDKSYSLEYGTYQISKLDSNNLLVASLQGLWKFNVKKSTLEALPGIAPDDAFANQIVYGYEDKHHQLYKCPNGLGFFVYKKNGNDYKSVFTFNKSITVKHIIPKNDSLLWIGTSNGLYLFNNLQLKMEQHFTMENGLPNNVVYAIAEDEKNNLWLGTNKGLSYLNVADNSFTNFTEEDGLQANEFNSHAVLRAKDGRIIFGGVNGLTVVNPDVLTYETQYPSLQITAIKADSFLNPYPYNEKNTPLILQPGNNSFEIEFTAINFNNPKLCKIRYRLKDFDNAWQYVANTGIARYIKLPPGKYILEAMASNTRGEFGNEIKQLVIIVKANWWQTTWFKVAAAILVVLLISSGIAFYLRQKLNREKEKSDRQFAIQTERERITADLHDDVGATLSSMYIYGDLAKSVWDTQPEQSKEMVGKISSQSKEAMMRMSDIVWSLKPAGEEKNALTLRLKNYTQELLAAKGITAIFNIDETIAATIKQPMARKNILLIAKEAINNIAKHSEAKQAVFTLRQEGENIHLIISDDGKGFDNINATAGNGLDNIEQRCKQLNGNCTISATPSNGATITCIFPITIISHSS